MKKKLISLLIIKLLILLSILLNCYVCHAGIDFDGVDDYIDTSYTDAYTTSDNFTISFWLNTTQSLGSSRVDILGIVQEEGAYDPQLIITNRSNDNGKITIRIYDINGAGTGFVAGTTTINDGSWHYIVLLRNVTDDKYRLYIDGGSDELNLTDPLTGTIDFSNTAIYLGALNNRGTAAVFSDVTLNEVAIWNIALSATDIEILYKSKIKGMPLQIKPDNLVGYWPLGDICDGCDLAGATFVDRSGNGNTGTGSDANASGGQGKGEEVLTYMRRR